MATAPDSPPLAPDPGSASTPKEPSETERAQDLLLRQIRARDAAIEFPLAIESIINKVHGPVGDRRPRYSAAAEQFMAQIEPELRHFGQRLALAMDRFTKSLV